MPPKLKDQKKKRKNISITVPPALIKLGSAYATKKNISLSRAFCNGLTALLAAESTVTTSTSGQGSVTISKV